MKITGHSGYSEGDGTMDDLKPCDFCGSEVDIRYGDIFGGIVCRDENSICRGSGLSFVFLPENAESAIAAWNTRTPPPGYMLVPMEGAEERVARAIAVAGDYYTQFHRGLSSPSADKIRKQAKAAIKALTEE